MGLIESWQENRDRIAEEIGGSVTKVRERSLIVDGATKVFCYIAEFHPDNYNQASPFFRSLLDSTCKAKGEGGLTPRPDTFVGGQCDALYRVYITARKTFTNTGEFIQEREVYLSIHPGPINKVYIEYQPIERGFTGVFAIIEASPPDEPYRDDRPLGGNNISEEIISTRIVRDDGQPDECGDPDLPERPSTEPIPEAEKHFNVTFDDDVMVFDLDLSAPIENRLVFINNDFNVVVDLDGFKTETEPEKPTVVDDPGGKTTVFKPEELDKTPVLEEGEEVEEENEEVEFVTVTVTKLPDSGRTYLSENADDIHINAAYLRWMGTGDGARFSYPDIAIRRLKTVHKRPDEAGAYRVYAVNGAKISVDSYTEKVEAQV